jgi:hypothetical protein
MTVQIAAFAYDQGHLENHGIGRNTTSGWQIFRILTLASASCIIHAGKAHLESVEEKIDEGERASVEDAGPVEEGDEEGRVVGHRA